MYTRLDTNTIRPQMALTDRKKAELYDSVEGWAENCIHHFISQASHFLNDQLFYGKYDLYRNYQAYNGVIDDKEYSYLRDPYALGEEFEFPAVMKSFNIIKPVIDTLMGEEMGRKQQFSIYCNDEENIQIKEEIIGRMMFKKYLFEYYKELEATGILKNVSESEKKFMQEMEEWEKDGSKTRIEKVASDFVHWFMEHSRLKEVWKGMFFDKMISDSCYCRIEEYGNEIRVRKVSPLNIYHSAPTPTRKVQDCDWIVEKRFMSLAQVLDNYHKYLKKADIEKIQTEYISHVRNDIYFVSQQADLGEATFEYESKFGDDDYYIDVYNIEWRAGKQISIVRKKDPENELDIVEYVDENYKAKEGEKIESIWITEIWEGTRIGTDFFVNVRPKPVQMRHMRNPSQASLSYVGKIGSFENIRPRSLVEIGMAYQTLYNILYYRLELAIERAKTPSTIYDVAQIPYSKGMDLAKVMYYDENFGFNFIDSTQNDGSGRTGFNQFQTIPRSDGGLIQILITTLEFVRQNWERLAGVPQQRQGNIGQYETVGGVERALEQSAFSTQYMYDEIDEIKKDTIEMLLSYAKVFYQDGFQTQYITGDKGLQVLRIQPQEFSLAEFGVYASTDREHKQTTQKLQELINSAIQSGQASLLDAINILTADSIIDMKQKLGKALMKNAAQAEEQRKAQEKAEQEKLQYERGMKQAEMEMEERIAKENNATKIEMAVIQADSRVRDDDNNEYENYKTKRSEDLEELKGDTQNTLEKLGKKYEDNKREKPKK